MTHSSPHGYIPFQLTLGNGLLHSINSKNVNQDENITHQSKSIEITCNINTGIIYLPLPKARLQLVKPQQSLDFKHQIEEDFRIRYQYLNNEELNKIFSKMNKTDANRYINSYKYLYKTLLQSILNNIDINEEISEIKHSIIYKNEILPILIHNHKLANSEKKILYNIVTKTWQKFDEGIQNEINVQLQLEQIKTDHKHLTNMKIKQEQYQTFYLKLHQINNDINHLKKEIQQLLNSKHELQDEIQEIKTHCSHNLIHLDHLKTALVRSHTNELNNLQLERDSLITQTELIKYNLFEQVQQYDEYVRNYRTSLNTYRLTLIQLEQELKEETDDELINLQIINSFSRQTIHDDTQKLIFIIENKIEENKFRNIQLQKSIEDFQEKISKQKQSLIKKQNDYKSMENIQQQLNQNINIYRELYLQIKTERRNIEHELKLKSKQYSNDDRLHYTLVQHHDSLIARKRLEEIRINTSNERIYPLIDENQRLKTLSEQFNHEYTQINPNNLFDLRENIFHLKEIHQKYLQDKILYQNTINNSQLLDQQLQTKNNRIINRINIILKRIQQNENNFKDNHKHIQTLENKLNEDQQQYLQSKYLLTQMINQSQSYKNKQNLIQMQTQVLSNNIKHSQYRLKTFTEQLFICHNDLTDQQMSLRKLHEFYCVLKEQDGINLKKLSMIYNQIVDRETQYKISEKSLEQTNENLIKYVKVRSVLGRMVVRRVNLCQLLYKKLAVFDEHIHQREQNIQIVSKCIKSLITQIRQIRDQNKKSIEKKDEIHFETVKVHINKMLDHSHEKQRLLTKKIFQRRFYIKHSLDPLPSEDINYLKRKYYLLKNRLIKLLCRGIICNFVFLSIQQEFSNHLQLYTSKTNREYSFNFYSIRTNLYQLMRQLKAKTAENNMLIDYKYYFQLIHTDTIQQLMQWKSYLNDL